MCDLNLGIFDRKITAPQEQSSSRIVRQDTSSTSSEAGAAVTGEDNSSSSANTSSNNTAFITFGIVKKDEHAPSGEYDSLTRQLFPVTGLREEFSGIELGSSAILANTDEDGNKQWLNLSSNYADSGETQPTVLERNKHQVGKKSRRGPKSRSSQYRGVTFYRRTGRWESHIWDCGKQVYLGGFDTAYAAARAYDRAALKFRGPDADINFEVSDYEADIKKTKNLTKEEFVRTLRREYNGFSRGSSKYKGLTLHKCCDFRSTIGNKDWDVTAIKCNDMGKEGIIMIDANNKGSEQNLELRLGVSSSKNTDVKMVDSCPGCNQHDGSSKKQHVSLKMATKNPNFLETTLETAASSGFPHFMNTTDFSSRSPCRRLNN